MKRHRKRGQAVIQEDLAKAYGVTIPPQNAEDRYLSPNDIGKILNITGEAVKQWIYHRRLPAVKLANGYWKVRVSDFEAFLKARTEIGRRRILIIGEETLKLSTLVSSMNHHPIVANNATDAAVKMLDQQPALLLVSLNGTGLKDQSFQVVREARKDKKNRGVPVLVLVSRETLKDSDTPELSSLGVQGVIYRDATYTSVSDEINRLLNRS